MKAARSNYLRNTLLLSAWTLLGAGLCTTIEEEATSQYCIINSQSFCVHDPPGRVGERCRCGEERGRFRS